MFHILDEYIERETVPHIMRPTLLLFVPAENSGVKMKDMRVTRIKTAICPLRPVKRILSYLPKFTLAEVFLFG
jgi:hypothetical protein